MEYVHPIKDLEKIDHIKQYLKEKSSRDYLLFVIGINTGLRISEILPLTYQDFIQNDGELVDFLTIKNQDIYINGQIKSALTYHINNQSTFTFEDYLFPSKRQGYPLTRQHAYRTIHAAAREVNIQDNIGTHTLRKTFGYHAYKKGIAISLIQKRFNQSTPSETLKYIGIDSAIRQQIDVNL